MPRFDLFGPIHKALRAALVETAAGLARTDFADPAAAAGAAASVRRALGLLDEHADHEDAVVLPAMDVVGADLASELRSAHARSHGMAADLLGLAERLAGAGTAEREALGQRLHERLWRLVGEELAHMDQEETAGGRLLRAHLGDDGLRALEARVLSRIAPERLGEWVALLLGAVSPAERRTLVAELRVALPPRRLDEVLGPARALLGADGPAEALPC